MWQQKEGDMNISTGDIITFVWDGRNIQTPAKVGEVNDKNEPFVFFKDEIYGDQCVFIPIEDVTGVWKKQ